MLVLISFVYAYDRHKGVAAASVIRCQQYTFVLSLLGVGGLVGKSLENQLK